MSDTFTVPSEPNIPGYSRAYDTKLVKSSTIASFLPPDETPLTV